MDGKHPLGLGVEGNLEHFGILVLVLRAITPKDPNACLHDRHLRRGSSHHPFAIRLGGIVENTTLGEAEDRRVLNRSGPLVFSASAGGKSISVRNNISCCHTPGGQCPCLVRAQHAHAAQGLNSVNLAHEHLPPHHTGGSDHQTDGHRRQQSFRDLCEERCSSILQDEINGPLYWRHQVGHQGQHTDRHCNIGDDMDKMFDLGLQRRASAGALRHCLVDLTQESIIASREYNPFHLALQHCRSKEADIVSLMDCHAFSLHFHCASFRERLSSQCSIIHLSTLRAENNADVRWDFIPSLKYHQLSRNQITRLNPLFLHHLPASLKGIAIHADQLSTLHVLQRLHHGFGLQLCPPLQRSRRNNDHREDQGSQSIIAIEDHCQRELTSHTDPQHDVEQTAKDLLEQHEKDIFLHSRRQLILSEQKQVLSRLVHRKPSAFLVVTTCRSPHIGIEHAGQFFSPEHVWTRLSLRQ
mmetsp:Transcript_38274/g.93734  ORF Transcript_38274/g.93734 Transcript_38274/m.93734 type:complete len:469 (-) Transcript_38274:464-1870(-)